MDTQGSQDAVDRRDLDRCRAGDPAGLERLYRTWSPKVYGLALRTLRRPDAAEDVVQETFLQVHRNARGFRGEAKFSTWLYTIALNACRMRLRRDKRQTLPLERAEDVPAPETPQSSGALLAALETLDEETRELLLLSAQENSYDEMAELLRLTPDQVRGRLYRARKLLLDRMKEGEHAHP